MRKFSFIISQNSASMIAYVRLYKKMYEISKPYNYIVSVTVHYMWQTDWFWTTAGGDIVVLQQERMSQAINRHLCASDLTTSFFLIRTFSTRTQVCSVRSWVWERPSVSPCRQLNCTDSVRLGPLKPHLLSVTLSLLLWLYHLISLCRHTSALVCYASLIYLFFF